MHELTFYRQGRYDGGIRSGIELDGKTTLLTDFQEGDTELHDDPLGSALLWYVDLRCRGADLPTEPEEARQWLVRHSAVIQDGLNRFADAAAAGADGSFPLQWRDFPQAPNGIDMEIVCSTVRRVTGHELGTILSETASHFQEYLSRLSEPEPLLR